MPEGSSGPERPSATPNAPSGPDTTGPTRRQFIKNLGLVGGVVAIGGPRVLAELFPPPSVSAQEGAATQLGASAWSEVTEIAGNRVLTAGDIEPLPPPTIRPLDWNGYVMRVYDVDPSEADKPTTIMSIATLPDGAVLGHWDGVTRLRRGEDGTFTHKQEILVPDGFSKTHMTTLVPTKDGGVVFGGLNGFFHMDADDNITEIIRSDHLHIVDRADRFHSGALNDGAIVTSKYMVSYIEGGKARLWQTPKRGEHAKQDSITALATHTAADGSSRALALMNEYVGDPSDPSPTSDKYRRKLYQFIPPSKPGGDLELEPIRTIDSGAPGDDVLATALSPDGSHMFMVNSSHQLWRLDTRTGGLQQIESPDLDGINIGSLACGERDGKPTLFAVGRSDGGLVTVEEPTGKARVSAMGTDVAEENMASRFARCVTTTPEGEVIVGHEPLSYEETWRPGGFLTQLTPRETDATPTPEPTTETPDTNPIYLPNVRNNG